MSSVKGKKPWGKDVQKQTYRSSKEFAEQIRTPTEREANELAEFKKKESEFNKPYAHDNYEEMEYDFIPPDGDLRFDPLTYSDVDWDRPQLEPGLYPGPYVPLSDYTFFCGIDPCFCPGQTLSFDGKCTYKIVSVSIIPITNTDGLFSVGGGGQNITITASASADDWDNFSFDINMRAKRPGRNRGFVYGSHSQILVTKCPESECCGCDAINPLITYTTQSMAVDEEQSLGISETGDSEASCFKWSLSGGGSLSDETGFTTTYTAPSSNADCAYNPTITLKCGGVVVDTLDIAVNAWPGTNEAYSVGRGNPSVEVYAYGYGDHPTCTEGACSGTVHGYSLNFQQYKDRYQCDGSPFSTPASVCSGASCSGGCSVCAPGCGAITWDCSERYDTCKDYADSLVAAEETCQGTVDVRSAAMISGGCCPEALL